MANIELDGGNKKITVDSGDLTLDIPGDIILDADGADLVFADGGTNILKITNSSSDVVFQPQVDAKDIIFKQYDGTTVATVEDNGTFNVPASKLAIGGTAVTSTAAELNLLDGGTSVGSSITVADADGFIVNDGGTMKTIPATDLSTYVGGGITGFDQWKLTTSATGDLTPISSNLSQVSDTGTGTLGSAMTQSSGIFTFPATGYWLVQANFDFYLNGANRASEGYIVTTTDNSSYSDYAVARTNQYNSSDNTHSSSTCSAIIDVTNTSNVKVKFNVYQVNDSSYTGGDSGVSLTYFTFIRLGDT